MNGNRSRKRNVVVFSGINNERTTRKCPISAIAMRLPWQAWQAWHQHVINYGNCSGVAAFENKNETNKTKPTTTWQHETDRRLRDGWNFPVCRNDSNHFLCALLTALWKSMLTLMRLAAKVGCSLHDVTTHAPPPAFLRMSISGRSWQGGMEARGHENPCRHHC